MPQLGNIVEAQRARAGFWLLVYWGLLAVFVVVNIFLRPQEPHFGLDAYPGFWPVFGFGVGLVMIWVMKKVVQPLIARDEDYYDDL